MFEKIRFKKTSKFHRLKLQNTYSTIVNTLLALANCILLNCQMILALMLMLDGGSSLHKLRRYETSEVKPKLTKYREIKLELGYFGLRVLFYFLVY